MSNTNEEVRGSEIDDTTSPLKPGKIFRKVTGASLIAGFFLLFVSLGMSGEVGTMGKIVGFSFVLVGLIMFLSNTLSKIVRSKNEESKYIFNCSNIRSFYSSNCPYNMGYRYVFATF